MPKIRTHKGAQSRFRVTGSGKIMRMKSGASHLRRRKSKRVKRLYYETLPLNPANKKQVEKLLPYRMK